MPVLAAVVVWGKGAHDIPAGGCLVDGVHFVAGRQLRPWLAGRDPGELTKERAVVMLADLRRFRRRVDPNRKHA